MSLKERCIFNPIELFPQKWQERPLACVVMEADSKEDLSEEDILAFLKDKVVKWWLPDEIVFIDEIPKTSTGKFSKKTLREQYAKGQLTV